MDTEASITKNNTGSSLAKQAPGGESKQTQRRQAPALGWSPQREKATWEGRGQSRRMSLRVQGWGQHAGDLQEAQARGCRAPTTPKMRRPERCLGPPLSEPLWGSPVPQMLCPPASMPRGPTRQVAYLEGNRLKEAKARLPRRPVLLVFSG